MDKEDFIKVITPEIKFQLVRKIEVHKIVALNESSLLPHEEKFLEFHKPAGVILFERNVESQSQLGELTAAIKEKLSYAGLDPLIMVDHEGDLVSQLRKIIGVPPSPMAIASTGDVVLAREVSVETGKMIRKLGINTVLAPSADCCFNLASPVTGLRSFGADPEKVTGFVIATLDGFGEAGVISCIKHFPGHGSTTEDSHEKIPIVTKSPDELKRADIVPFVHAFAHGVDICMISHVAFEFKDDGSEIRPASFNKKIVTDLLRRDLGFEGVVITDALEMEAARQHARGRYGGLAGGLERPLLAGADLLLYTQPVPERMFFGSEGESVMSLKVIETIIQTLERVVDRSRIEKKLEEAAKHSEGLRNLLDIFKLSEQRVRLLREKATSLALPPKEPQKKKVIELSDYPTVPGIYKDVAERSIALLRDPAGFIPASNEAHTLVPVIYHPGGGIGFQEVGSFMDVLMKHFPSWKRTAEITGFSRNSGGKLKPDFAGANQGKPSGFLGAKLEDADAVIPVFSARGGPPEEFIEGMRAFAEEFSCRFAIITGWPLFQWLPANAGALVTFGASAQVASATARVLSGEIPAQGMLEHFRS